MAGTINAGSVVWNFDVDSKAFAAGLGEAAAAAKATGATVSKGFSKTANDITTEFGKVGDSLGNILTKVALVGAAGAGLGSLFLKSAGDMQIVSKSMEVLVGNTQAANELFAQLAQYANKTPFEFKDIADAGRVLLGFGIPLQNVIPNVKMLGDLAGVTGADFKSLAVVFGQVNATGRLMGQDALQLINNNIPITTILAKKLGTTVQDVKARMEDGAISADLFNQALLETTQAGGFAFQGADKLAETFNGRLSTLKDTVLEFGRNLLGVKIDPKLGLVVEDGGVFDKLSKALPKIGDELQKITPQVKAAFDFLIRNGNTIVAIVVALGSAFIAMKIGAFIGNIVMLAARFAFLTGMMSTATAAQWGFNTAAAANPIGLIVVAIAALIGILVFLQVRFKIFTKLWDGMKAAFGAVVNFVKDHVGTLKKVLVAFATVIASPFLPFIALTVIIVKNWDTIRDAVVNTVTTIWNIIKTVFTAIWNFLSPILKFLLDLYIIVFGGILLIVLTVIQAIWNVIKSVFTAIYNFLVPIVQAIWDFLVAVFTGIWNTVVTIFTAIFDFYVKIWTAIADFFLGIIKKIIDFFAPAFNWLLDKGKDIINGLVSGIRAVADAVWGAVKFVADKIGDFFKGAASWLFDVGKAIVQGLIDGIKSMVKAVGDAAGNIGNAVKDKVKSLLGIHSPSKVMAQYGQYTMQGFADGISKGNKMIMSSLGNSLDPVYAPTVNPSMDGLEYDRGPAPIVNHIGEINIGSEVDGQNWLKKLTRDDEVTRAGLNNYAV